MFVDDIDVLFKAGSGGDGHASFYPKYKSGPNGGDGGNGGSIYIKGSTDLTLLAQFSGNTKRSATKGESGSTYRKKGKFGIDFTVQLPIGTILTDKDTHEVFEVKNETPFLICQGGTGGLGTYALRSPSNTTPMHGENGTPGQVRKLHLELKLFADFGLIGLPNAGKSSLLNALTNARAKVGAYPFTTLEPNLGVWNGKIFADIPGLIEGASVGKGLGIKFLKHIEKVKLIIHCISSDSENIQKDYETIQKEIGQFNKKLLLKKQLILITKTDLISLEILSSQIKKLEPYGEVSSVSIYYPENFKTFTDRLVSNYLK